MEREILTHLHDWKKDPERIPLIIRGARQVGKTFIVNQFGERCFSSVASYNLEKRKDLHDIFQSLDPTSILSLLEVRTNVTITPGETLLFLDEIQACPDALMSLRYFAEELPELHVIAAGSLLEFALEDSKFSFPVGRVQFGYMQPLSFREFLRALQYEKLVEYLSTVSLTNPVDDGVHRQLLELVSLFFFIGGMPKAVASFTKYQSHNRCQNIHRTIFDSYEEDFGKYAKHAQHQYMQRLFERAPQIIGDHIKFSKMDPSNPNAARVYRPALDNLSRAGLVHQVFATTANGLPLRAEKIENKFKIILVDIGLLQCALDVHIEDLIPEHLLLVNRGALAEQFVGQELLAYMDWKKKRRLYFWERLKKGSEAEIDYVVNIKGRIVPIEVKAGKTGSLRSLKQFLVDKKVPFGIRISESPLSWQNQVLSVPLYFISELPRLIQECH